MCEKKLVKSHNRILIKKPAQATYPLSSPSITCNLQGGYNPVRVHRQNVLRQLEFYTFCVFKVKGGDYQGEKTPDLRDTWSTPRYDRKIHPYYRRIMMIVFRLTHKVKPGCTQAVVDLLKEY